MGGIIMKKLMSIILAVSLIMGNMAVLAQENEKENNTVDATAISDKVTDASGSEETENETEVKPIEYINAVKHTNQKSL